MPAWLCVRRWLSNSRAKIAELDVRLELHLGAGAQLPAAILGAHEQHVGRLDVAMQDVLRVQVVQGLGHLVHVADQLARRNAGIAGAATLLQAIGQGAVGQLHDDDKPVLV